MKHSGRVSGVDDMPYIIGLGMDIALDLHGEYQAIIRMYDEDRATVPLKAFFGDLLDRPLRRKNYPLALPPFLPRHKKRAPQNTRFPASNIPFTISVPAIRATPSRSSTPLHESPKIPWPSSPVLLSPVSAVLRLSPPCPGAGSAH